MGFTGKVMHRLWGEALALCCKCKTECVEAAGPDDDRSNIGECAHIVGEAAGAARHDPSWSREQLDDETNGLLLCANCHKIADDQVGRFTVEALRDMKHQHTSWLKGLVRRSMGSSRLERTVILHSRDDGISEDLALEALAPDYPAFPVVRLAVDPGSGGWRRAADRQRETVAALRAQGLPNCYTVYSLGDIPLCVHLGYLLGSKCPVAVHQYDRDRGRWGWPDAAELKPGKFTIQGLPDGVLQDEGPVILRVSLSAEVRPTDCAPCVSDTIAAVDLMVPEPSTDWLRHSVQLDEFAKTFRGVLGAVNQRIPGCTGVHLFAAVPTGAAIQMGRHMNPNMDPPLHVWQYSRTTTPRYACALTIAGDTSL